MKETHPRLSSEFSALRQNRRTGERRIGIALPALLSAREEGLGLDFATGVEGLLGDTALQIHEVCLYRSQWKDPLLTLRPVVVCAVATASRRRASHVGVTRCAATMLCQRVDGAKIVVSRRAVFIIRRH